MDRAETESPNEEDIPLLEDVVDPDEIFFSLDNDQEFSDLETTPASVAKAVRDEVTAKLLNELNPIISIAIETAVQQVTEQIKLVLEDELEGTLEHRLRALIQEALEKNKPRSQP